MRVGTVLLALVGAHTLLCIGRIPTAVYWKRWQEIAQYRSEGDLENLFRRAELEGAGLVRWLQANTAPGTAILFAGELKGPLEFAAAALWPRLLVNSLWLPPDAKTAAGLPIARGTLPSGESGAFVLEADRKTLTLEVRR